MGHLLMENADALIVDAALTRAGGTAGREAALAKIRHRGLDRVGWMFTLTAAAYNLVRLPKLLAEAPT